MGNAIEVFNTQFYMPSTFVFFYLEACYFVFQKPVLTLVFPFGFQTQYNNDILAYWLSNESTLLLLLQRTLKASGATGMAPQRVVHHQLLYLGG